MTVVVVEGQGALGTDFFSQRVGFENQGSRSPTHDPELDLVCAGNLGLENNRAVFLLMNLLRAVPDLLADVSGDFLVKADFDLHRGAQEHAEASLHQSVEIEIGGDVEGLFRGVEHLDAVEGEDADLAGQAAVADQVEGPVVEPHLVGGHLSLGHSAAAHGVVDNVEALALQDGLVDLVDDFLELFVLLVRTGPGAQTFCDLLQVFFGLGRQGGADFLEKRLQGIVKHRTLQTFKHVTAEIEGHELGEAERNREVVLDRVEQRPDALAVDPFGVHGETGGLQGVQVAVDGAGVAVEVAGQVGGGLAYPGGDESLDDLPLPCELVTACHKHPLFCGCRSHRSRGDQKYCNLNDYR